MIDILLLPALACALLVPIHAWFGIHVLDRGVIFVDLALAQLAALGLALMVAGGWDPSSPAAYVGSISTALAGALVFAFVRGREDEVPQEAIIGIVYGVATALSVLVLAPSPHGLEEIQAMLVGTILLVDAKTLASAGLVYLLVALIHVALRRVFLRLTLAQRAARLPTWRERLWDLAFYASFAVVITSSVRIAGVLVVFTFLIVPAVAARMLVERVLARLLVAIAFGLLAAAIGLVASFLGDHPTGSALVVAHGVCLVAVALARTLLRSCVR